MFYFLISGIFVSGFTSFSESTSMESTSTKPKEIIIEIEPPKENFENNSKEQEKQELESENSDGGSPYGYTSYVTGSSYARNGEAILINTPEGIKINEKLIDQRELNELEILHGEEFWERIDKLTYEHFGLADALLNTNTENTYFTKGGTSSENSQSNLEYYLLERGYDPTDLSNVPNNVFTPLKYDLARAVIQNLDNPNVNNLDLSKFKNIDLELLAPNAFSMTEEDQNMMYHNDVESRAMSMLKSTLPTISSSQSEYSESANQQNSGDLKNQDENANIPIPDSASTFSQEMSHQQILIPLDQELFQNTEHIKKIISQDDFSPNYETMPNSVFPILEILLSIIFSSIAGIAIFFTLKKYMHKTKNVFNQLTVSTTSDYRLETQKLLEQSNLLYTSKQIKDAYEKFSYAIRFYYSHHYDIKNEVTTFEILDEIKIKEKSNYAAIHDCLTLCGIVEFAKHDERKNDFVDCLSIFYKIIALENKIQTKTTGDNHD
tara:strand:- start:2151 stop:3629 length:1479 start_codon:yes stop_codon:yes gene_type:complete